MRRYRPQALRLGVFLVAVTVSIARSTASAGAPADLIRLTEPQIRAAGIRLAALQPGNSPSGEQTGLRMTGQVLLPGNRTGTVPSAVAGYLEAVFVQPGEAVKAGQPLALLHGAELAPLQRSFLEAKAAAALASRRLGRDQTLFDEGIIAEYRLRESELALQTSRAAEQAQRRLLVLSGYAPSDIERITPESISTSVTLRAPEAGVVLDQPIPAGQPVTPGTILFRLGAPGNWWLELEAQSSQARSIEVGDVVRVGGCPSNGRVIAVGGQFRSASQTIPVRATMPDAGRCLSPNQFVEASVLRGSAAGGVLSAPSAALVRSSNRDYVFIRRAEGFQPTAVTVERREGEFVLLRAQAGLQTGTQVASGGLIALKGAWMGLGPQAGARAN